ncbi:TetR/AcrR family transcriptional regulator [Abyssisolibacter fermentans]|uniref:TetR/AcrR family transcriptional regulator n=1 Tax=Abyssisolibacter fermentans TaxID=1766203 RepID=UPI00082EEF8D|nr:TetR/AcrR family transcriptional regulator [Abyssisolibacter fermentans]
MNKRFEHIDINNEKVYRIVNSAFKVFSNNDLEKASTNMVVTQAGISRGLLYHYFKDKQELFDFLLYFSVKVIMIDLKENINWEDSDILNRMRQGLIIKLQEIKRFPYMIDFYAKYGKLTRSIIDSQTEEIFPGIREKFYTYNLDFSQVKDDIDIEKMISVITFTLKGIINEYLDMTRTSSENFEMKLLVNKCDEYFEFFRKQFFK